VAAFAEREVGLAPLALEAALPAGLAAALGGAANTVQLLPHRHGTDGFFISAFEKR
jgi:16S rRNA (cytosine967-C5)-methyltransferase